MLRTAPGHVLVFLFSAVLLNSSVCRGADRAKGPALSRDPFIGGPDEIEYQGEGYLIHFKLTSGRCGVTKESRFEGRLTGDVDIKTCRGLFSLIDSENFLELDYHPSPVFDAGSREIAVIAHGKVKRVTVYCNRGPESRGPKPFQKIEEAAIAAEKRVKWRATDRLFLCPFEFENYVVMTATGEAIIVEDKPGYSGNAGYYGVGSVLPCPFGSKSNRVDATVAIKEIRFEGKSVAARLKFSGTKFDGETILWQGK